MSIPPLGQNRPGPAQKRPAGIGASYALNPTPQGRAAGFIPVQPAGHTEVITQAPTLGQFWRSDIRHTTGGRVPRWAGATAFWVGLLALAFLVIGSLAGIQVIRAIAFPLSFVAALFAFIALIAGIGRVLGFFGLLLALAANVVVLAGLAALFS